MNGLYVDGGVIGRNPSDLGGTWACCYVEHGFIDSRPGICMKKKDTPAIAALRSQIQRIAFDANIWDRGIGDYPYAEKCSKKRKRLLAEIARLQGKVEILRRNRQKRNLRLKNAILKGNFHCSPFPIRTKNARNLDTLNKWD